MIAFIAGAFVGKIQESSREWSYWLKFASLFASYSILFNILGLMWEGSLELLLIVTAPTFILFIFGLMGNESPSLWDLTTIYSMIIITSAVIWFIIGLFFGLIYGKINGEHKDIGAWFWILFSIISILIIIGLIIYFIFFSGTFSF